ncbi:MAG: hypothetical protein Unbinned3849contig1000_46 [Prokaryotic dsDNA virus sp.]|nr:MAG: hypothetical protein Unbinned3849contig1000_46 [Prokaryotic dsDNA virus sp.]|tara:strand:+ start:2241 stop:2693 length:453 start_codon:yes stop_codon:yes gene_type:complete
MASTRMRVSTSSVVFHRIAASGDMAQHDVGTTDTVAQNMGGTADFEIESDETVAHVDASAVFDASESTIGSAAIADYIYIKNTGFTSSDKDTTTTSNLTVGVGGTFANGGFTLAAGEAITLHGLGGGSNNLSEFQLDSSSGNIYVEIKYL